MDDQERLRELGQMISKICKYYIMLIQLVRIIVENIYILIINYCRCLVNI